MCNNVYDDVIDLKFVNSSKTQKFKYLANKTLNFLQMEKVIHHTLSARIWQKGFLVEVTFKCNRLETFHF